MVTTHMGTSDPLPRVTPGPLFRQSDQIAGLMGSFPQAPHPPQALQATHCYDSVIELSINYVY